MNTNRSNVSKLVKLISTSSENEEILVTTTPNTTIVLAGKLANAPCKVSLSSTTNRIQMLFETEEIELPQGLETVSTLVAVKPGPTHWLWIPVLNNSKHGIILWKNKTMGRIEQISSYKNKNVTQYKYKNSMQWCQQNQNELKRDTSTETVWYIKIIDVSGMKPKQRQMLELMFIQEAVILSVETSDIGNVTSSNIDIKLHDNTPVHTA